MADVVATIQIVTKGERQVVKLTDSVHGIVSALEEIGRTGTGQLDEDVKKSIAVVRSLEEHAKRAGKELKSVNVGIKDGGVTSAKAGLTGGRSAPVSAREAISKINAIYRKQVRELTSRATKQTGIEQALTQKSIALTQQSHNKQIAEIKRKTTIFGTISKQSADLATQKAKQTLAIERSSMRASIANAKTALRERKSVERKREMELIRLTKQGAQEELRSRRARVARIKAQESAGGMTGGASVGGGGIGEKLKGAFRIDKDLRQSVSALVGFAGLEITQQLQQVFQRTRLEGVVGPLFGKVFGIIGSLFGQTISSIMSDLGDALGNIAEAILNTFTGSFRIVLSTMTGLAKGLSRVIVASILGGLLGSIPGLIVSAVVVLFTGLTEAFNSIFLELQSLVSSLFKAITGVISAALKAAVGIIQAFGKAAIAIFKGLFEGIKALVNGFITSVKAGFEILYSLTARAVKEFSALQLGAARAFKEVINVIGQTEEKFQSLISLLQTKYGAGIAEANAAVFDAVSSGFRSVAEATKIVETAAKLGIGAEATLADSTNTLITVIQNFDEGAENIEDRFKSLSAATTLARATLQEFGPALNKVAGTARIVGLEFDDLLTSMSVLTRRFGRGSAENVARFLNRLLEAISMPRSDAAKQFKELGIEVQNTGDVFGDIIGTVEKLGNIDLSKLRDFFPTIQARKAFLALAKNTDEFRNVREELKKLKPLAEAQFNVIYRTFDRAVLRIQGSVSRLFSYIGGFLVSGFLQGPLNSLADSLDNLFSALSDPSKLKGAIDAFRNAFKPLSAAIFDPILNALDDFTNEAGKFDLEAFFKSETVTSFVNELTKIIKFLMNLPSTLMQSFEIVRSAVDGLYTAFDEIKEIAKEVFKVETLQAILDYVKRIGIEFDFLKEAFAEIWDQQGMAKFIDVMINAFTNALANIGSLVVSVFSTIWPIVANLFEGIVGIRIKKVILEAVGSAVGEISTKIKSLKIKQEPAKQGTGFLSGISKGFGVSGTSVPVENMLIDIFNTQIQDLSTSVGHLGLDAKEAATDINVVSDSQKAFNKAAEEMKTVMPLITVAMDEFKNKMLDVSRTTTSRLIGKKGISTGEASSARLMRQYRLKLLDDEQKRRLSSLNIETSTREQVAIEFEKNVKNAMSSIENTLSKTVTRKRVGFVGGVPASSKRELSLEKATTAEATKVIQENLRMLQNRLKELARQGQQDSPVFEAIKRLIEQQSSKLDELNKTAKYGNRAIQTASEKNNDLIEKHISISNKILGASRTERFKGEVTSREQFNEALRSGLQPMAKINEELAKKALIQKQGNVKEGTPGFSTVADEAAKFIDQQFNTIAFVEDFVKSRIDQLEAKVKGGLKLNKGEKKELDLYKSLQAQLETLHQLVLSFNKTGEGYGDIIKLQQEIFNKLRGDTKLNTRKRLEGETDPEYLARLKRQKEAAKIKPRDLNKELVEEEKRKKREEKEAKNLEVDKVKEQEKEAEKVKKRDEDKVEFLRQIATNTKKIENKVQINRNNTREDLIREEAARAKKDKEFWENVASP